MSDGYMNEDHRVYQDEGVYTTPDSQQVHILHGGDGAPDGDGHGHYIYGIPGDRVTYDRPPND